MAQEFNKSDFADLIFRVDLIDLISSDILHLFPDLKRFEEFTPSNLDAVKGKDIKPAQLLAYIVYTYDMSSPYVKKYNDDILKRKKAVCDAVLFRRLPTGDFCPLVRQIILCQNEIVNRMIIRYLRIIKNQYWDSICTYMEALMIANTCLLDPKMDSKEKKENLAMSITLRKELGELQAAFLAEQNVDLSLSLYDAIEEEELMTPEYVAEKTFMKENIQYFNPYQNKLPLDVFMKKVQNGESTWEWDNKEILQNKRDAYVGQE